MKTITEIENAIENLDAQEVEQLAEWFQSFRQRQMISIPVEIWLLRARGAARPGETTANIMALTRGED